MAPLNLVHPLPRVNAGDRHLSPGALTSDSPSLTLFLLCLEPQTQFPYDTFS